MEMTMKTAKLFFKTTCLFTAAILTGCTADVAQEEEKNKEPNPAATDITFTSENPSTRTSITHSIGNGATPFWSERDRIWVKDVNGTWQKSSEGKFSSDKSNGIFTFSSGTFKDNCEVHYTGVNGTADKVTIANEQRQSNPNDFSHAGVSGDCGIGTAKGNGKNFKFKLSHKASYLCFLPHSSNELIKKSKLIKIEVISKDNIAGTFDFSNGVLSHTRTRTNNSDKAITLITGNGFSIEGSTNIEKNGSYIVIAPGDHELTVRYWLRYKENSYSEEIKGTVTKTFKLNCEVGKIYDIIAKLDPTDYSNEKYYMWDCANGQDYWKGYESYQPKTKYRPAGQHYPNSVKDPRWYNEKSFPDPAYRSCKDCPNVNETWWYIQDGDPHWDSEELWVMYDHLYTGGMWLKKKNNISGFSSSRSPNGTDYTTKPESASYNNNNVPFGRPENSEKYFYLPALGGYDHGRFDNIGEVGNYWTCTPTPWNTSPSTPTKGAYYLYFYLDNKGKKCTASLYGGLNRDKGFTLWEKK
ncbi:hypothetical protein CBG55_01960 [Prevotella intermedia]|uniref:Fimbrillin family protein n=1 Tax=Prevotella intermedia TaxID=28131 RepID=A0A2M8TLU9_PREIN|nr:hypothetical protein [Prevotella intermedia]OWP33004.1 hypothetical protein CBG55_01960 [Prevotella intermedia]PJI24915.1 hypothetical protein CTM59_01955 [Prevotella intermedia]